MSKLSESESKNSKSCTNVHEIFSLMSTLLLPGIPDSYLQACKKILQRRHLESVFEERNVQEFCAFPSCDQRLKRNATKYRISLKRKSIKDATSENQFCSDSCRKNAHVYVSKLKSKPPQLLPPLEQVFGTAHPNPFTWKAEQRVSSKQCASSSDSSPYKTKCLWSKSTEANVLERNESAPPLRIVEKSSALCSNIEFPTVSQAVIIEGFVFPAHKAKVAKRLETRLAKSARQENEDQGCDTSEESQSDSENSSVHSSDSDEDIDSSISTEQLSLFSNVWRLFASWITRQTQELLAMGKVVSQDDLATNGSDPRCHKSRIERMMAFESILARSIRHLPLEKGICTDITAQKRLGHIVRTLRFPETIDGRNEQQWLCITLILVIIAQRQDLKEPLLQSVYNAVNEITGLNSAEIDQIMCLFDYSDDEVAVTTEELASQSIVKDIERSLPNDAASKMCRKCRRYVSKCACHLRENGTEREVTIEELDRMMMDAMELRKMQEF